MASDAETLQKLAEFARLAGSIAQAGIHVEPTGASATTVLENGDHARDIQVDSCAGQRHDVVPRSRLAPQEDYTGMLER